MYSGRARRLSRFALAAAAAAATLTFFQPIDPLGAQTEPPPTPTMVDRNLGVRTVVSGLDLPIGFTFIGRNDMLVLEKNTGRVVRVTNGVVQGPVLDLAVNNFSERGLLGIALHPFFPFNRGVYLYWSCTAPAPTDPFVPSQERCDDTPTPGDDSDVDVNVPLLGNRVDRFEWNGSALVFDRNLIMLRSFQNDAAPQPPGQGDEDQPARGNHDGGVIRFGFDRKLYVIIGDVGRRGQLQNLEFGPTPPTDDDQFGGPEPDNAHLTGVVLRLNEDGSAPRDNPFFHHGARIGGEVGQNLQKIFAYGIRNSFGMAVDPFSGGLWIQVNGDDSFDEIERVTPGLNSGWIQTIGPIARLNQFKRIETTFAVPPATPSLQQLRWPPSNIADSPEEARERLFMLPGARYRDPQFSWRFAVAPAGIGFMRGFGLGARYAGDLFVGASLPVLEGGYLFRFNLSRDRRDLNLTGALRDRVADNTTKHDITESESLLAGRNFGIGTDIKTGPNGNLFVVSLNHGAIYEVFRVREREDDDDDRN
jgi:aldose sugar dehydrogenase